MIGFGDLEWELSSKVLENIWDDPISGHHPIHKNWEKKGILLYFASKIPQTLKNHD